MLLLHEISSKVLDCPCYCYIRNYTKDIFAFSTKHLFMRKKNFKNLKRWLVTLLSAVLLYRFKQPAHFSADSNFNKNSSAVVLL